MSGEGRIRGWKKGRMHGRGKRGEGRSDKDGRDRNDKTHRMVKKPIPLRHCINETPTYINCRTRPLIRRERERERAPLNTDGCYECSVRPATNGEREREDGGGGGGGGGKGCSGGLTGLVAWWVSAFSEVSA